MNARPCLRWIADLPKRKFLLLLLLILSTLSWAANEGRIARSWFTTAIEDREPVDRVVVLDNSHDTLYFFTDVRHMEGHSITHSWEYNGQVISKKTFEIKGPRWRVYSKKELDPSMTGKWSVVIRDERGWPLTVAIFEYVDKAEGGKSMILPLSE